MKGCYLRDVHFNFPGESGWQPLPSLPLSISISPLLSSLYTTWYSLMCRDYGEKINQIANKILSEIKPENLHQGNQTFHSSLTILLHFHLYFLDLPRKISLPQGMIDFWLRKYGLNRSSICYIFIFDHRINSRSLKRKRSRIQIRLWETLHYLKLKWYGEWKRVYITIEWCFQGSWKSK